MAGIKRRGDASSEKHQGKRTKVKDDKKIKSKKPVQVEEEEDELDDVEMAEVDEGVAAEENDDSSSGFESEEEEEKETKQQVTKKSDGPSKSMYCAQFFFSSMRSRERSTLG